MAKNFLRSDALGFFKKAILAGGVTDIDDKILKKQFDSFLEANKEIFMAGAERAADTGITGVKRTIKATDYDYNKVIGKIGKDFGYEINFNNVKKLDDIVLEGGSYGTEYSNLVSNVTNKRKRMNYKRKEGLKQARASHARKTSLNDPEAYDVDADVANAFNSDVPIEGIPQYRRVGETSGPQRYKYENGEVVEGPTSGLTGSINDRLTQKRIKDYEQIDAELDAKYPNRNRNGNRKEKAAYQAYMREQQQRYDQVNKRLGYNPKVQRDANGELIDGEKDLGMAQKVLNDATGKDGIGLWGKAWGFAKNHPVITTGAAVGTVWGVSELMEDDDF